MLTRASEGPCDRLAASAVTRKREVSTVTLLRNEASVDRNFKACLPRRLPVAQDYAVLSLTSM